MKVKEIMSRNVEAIAADSNLVAAASHMRRLDIGFLPVLDRDVAGVITDRDIVVRAIAEAKNPTETKVGDVMTRDVEIVTEDQEVELAAAVMKDKQIRRVIVKDTANAYVGVLSLGDLAAAGHEVALSGETLKKVCAAT
jgi:CBS domain-containing protein